ncbi:MAG: hypothetical protein J6T74_09125 [Clostridia bacterium]|nr:hypothetical protein [Clostridia bacterium]
MWEFCISLSDKNLAISKKIYMALKEYCKNYNGIVTTYERCGNISILLSCEECDSARLKHYIENLIADVIVEDYKLKFLSENLTLYNLDEISKKAFMQALVSFDKESDKYIVENHLDLSNSLDLEAFYFFKLGALREKWKELVGIANDNKSYLSSNDTLVELLKFLVDNLELKNETINLMKEKDSIIFYDTNFNKLCQNQIGEKDIDSSIISSLISLAPKYVNIYCGENFNSNLTKLLKQIFDKRINFVNVENLLET